MAEVDDVVAEVGAVAEVDVVDVVAEVEVVGEVEAVGETAVVVRVEAIDDELLADVTLDGTLEPADVVAWPDAPASDAPASGGTGAIVTESCEVGADEPDCWTPLLSSDAVDGEACCAAAGTFRWAAAVEQAASGTAIASTPSTAVMPVLTERAVAPLP